MRILPREQRQAMFEIYAFCRRVDDIADSDLPRPERSATAGEAAGRHRRRLYAGGKPPADLTGLAQAGRRFALVQDDFLAVIDGMEMDAREDIRAPDFATLDLYCDRVASAVGRLSVRVFGMPEDDGKQLAGIWAARCSSPTSCAISTRMPISAGSICRARRWLKRRSRPPTRAPRIASPTIGTACSIVVKRAAAFRRRLKRSWRARPRRAVRAPRIMGEVYRRVLRRHGCARLGAAA